MRNKKLHNFFILGFLLSSMIISAQLRVIDNKGTVLRVDSSKWTRDGNNVYNKNLTGNVGVGIATPKATLHNAGSTVLGLTTASNSASTFTVPTATVDAYSGLTLTQTTVAAAVTISSPTATSTAGRVFTVINSSASTFNITIGTYVIAPGALATLVWDGTGWNPPSGIAAKVPFSGLTAATATNTIDNTNLAQTWNWATATTQSPLTMSGAALTTGNLLNLSAGSALTSGSVLKASGVVSASTTTGLINIQNTATATTGKVATIQANSTAGSGLTVLANGQTGIGTAAPGNTLEIKQGTAGNSGLRFTNLPNSTSPQSAVSVGGKYLSVNAAGDVVLASSADPTVEVAGLAAGLGATVSAAVFEVGTKEPVSTAWKDNTVIYINSADGSAYTWDGTNYITAASTSASTAWYIASSTTDAGSNKTGSIARTGKVAIGSTATPASMLEVNGAATNKAAYNAGAGTTIDFSLSNIAYTSDNTATTITLSNIKDGGAYTLIFTSTAASGTVAFSASGFSFVYMGTTARTSGKTHIYSLVVAGTVGYVTMATSN